MIQETVDVAIVGAGPYGLSLAAHLRAAGVPHRVFGEPMALWRSHMPAGMFLKSQGFASNLSSPRPGRTLADFCQRTGRPYAPYGLPVPLRTFVDYGDWFQRCEVPDLEEVLVTRVAEAGGGYAVSLADGTDLLARRVVVAVGVQHFPHVPEPLTALPAELCSHVSRHTDLGSFAGREVVVLGGGQSALESAALLHEAGAAVRVLARSQRVNWNGELLALDRPWWQRLREPEAGLGSGWGTWFYSNRPDLFRHLPARERVRRARTALGPAGSSWLRPRVDGVVPMYTGHTVTSAEPKDGGVGLTASRTDGSRLTLTADHVLAATGYRADVARLSFLDARLRARVRTVAGTPAVGNNFASSAPGLYFVGPAVAPTFGPVMRFVYGADFTARVLGRHLAASARRKRTVPVGAAR